MAQEMPEGLSPADAARGTMTMAALTKNLGVSRTKGYEVVRTAGIRRVRFPGMRHPRLLRADVERLVAEGIENREPI